MIVSMGSLLKGLACGATVMYFCDPDRGRRRRALLRDRTVGVVHDAEDLWRKGSRDLENRAWGIAAETKRGLQTGPVDDEVLIERVRAVLGHKVTDARHVEVEARSGMVTLRGTVRPGEPERAIPFVERIPGVRGVESALVTAGEPAPPPVGSHEMRPGTRLLLVAGGGLMLCNGLARRGFMPKLLGSFGAGLFAQGIGNRPARGFGGARRAGIPCRGTTVISAPVEKVYEFVSDVEQSGRFLPEGVEVESLGGGHVRWSCAGPGGIGTLECEEIILEATENERLVWASTDASPLRYLGEARFRGEGEMTRLDVGIIYAPPGGALTHAAASFLGLDPKTQLDASLLRIKRYLEAGTVPEGVVPEAGRKQHG